jgi:hydroxyacylglutathione hydrolase
MKLTVLLSTVLFAGILSATADQAWAQFPEPNGGTLEQGTLPSTWMTGGPKCMEVPEWQVHEFNPSFYILRQSGCTDFEKPFVYLIFGKERALLLDTGSRNGDLAPTLRRTIHNWLLRNHRQSIPLIVTHSHSHSDHVAGDAEIQALNDPAIPITFVQAKREETQTFYKISQWPEQIGSVDLGDRVLDVIPIPGHDTVSIALYDRRTGILLTGDSLYPGRLYVHDFESFQKSTERLIQFTEGKPVAYILGCHIEETRTPFLDYAIGTIYQPNEHELALSRGALLELEAGLVSLHGKPARLAMRDFSIWPAGRAYASSSDGADTFRKTQEQQLKKMWDQTQ